MIVSSYLFELFNEPGGFNATLHVKADVHFDLSEGVGEFDDGNLETTTAELLMESKKRDDSVNTYGRGTACCSYINHDL